MSARILRVATRSYVAVTRVLLRRHDGEVEEIRKDADALLRDAANHGLLALMFAWAALLWDAAVGGLRNDARQAVRTLVRSRQFTLGVSLIFGVGIAATATLFAIVDAVLLRPLPYDDPDRLVMVWETAQDRFREGPAPGNVIDWYANNESFDALTAWMTTSMTLRGSDGATPVTGVQVTRGFFDVFRRAPMLGRTFAADEYEGAHWNVANQFMGREPMLVLSHHLWRELGADAAIVGRTIKVEGREWRVLGVMPPDFASPDTNVAFWTPWDMAVSYRGARFPSGPPRDFRFLRVAARLKAGVTPDMASARMEAVAARIADAHPRTNSGWSVRVLPFADELVSNRRADLLVVFGAVLALLLLVCANVAGLALARATTRGRELAVRMALGAGRSRVIRQLVAESALIAMIAAAIGLLITSWWLNAVIAFAPADIPRLHEVRLDGRGITFIAALAMLVTILAGVMPAIRGTRAALAPLLRHGSAGAGDTRVMARRAIVISELAIALMLLVGAGLLMRSLSSLRAVDPGFDARNVLVMSITPDAARYRTGAQAAEYYRRVLDELRKVPSVISAAAVSLLPMSDVGSDFDRPFWLDGARPAGESAPEADVRMATPGYFETMGRPLLRGREFSDRDDRQAPRVVVINEALARSTFPGDDPVGRSLILDYQGGAYPYEVIGVVRDARYQSPRSAIKPEIFIPHAQNPYLVMNIVARTSVDAHALASTARAQALRVDADQPVHEMTTMDDLLAGSMEQERFGTLLLSMFAIAGLVVASTGVYSLFAYAVSQRRREIALRIAVGASPGGVARMVMTESVMLAGIGVAIGLAGAIAIARVAGTVLFGVPAYDPMTLVATSSALIVVVLIATWWPARQATRVDPVIVMRS